MTIRPQRILRLLSAGVLALVFTTAAAEWPQWRGLHRDGTSPETGLLKSWPAAGPPVDWRAGGLGEGFSAVAVSQGRLFTQGQQGGEQSVIALDVASGQKLWQTASGRSFRESRGNGPRATPTVDGDRLYALAADGALACLETATGRKVWELNIVRQFGGDVPNWGIAESPLVDGERLIVTPGGRGAAVVALNKRTGAVIWKALNDEAGYSSAIAATVDGVHQVIVFTGEGAVGLRSSNGEGLWRYDRVSNRVANIATPIYRDGHVFLSSDYGTGCALLQLSRAGNGWRPVEVYFNRDMRNHYSSSVLVGDHLYGYSSAVLTAMQWSTGEVAWRDRSVGKGSVTYADGRLYLMGEDGTVGLAEATPRGYQEKSRFRVPRGEYPAWTPLVISDGRMYLRVQDQLYAYNIKER